MKNSEMNTKEMDRAERIDNAVWGVDLTQDKNIKHLKIFAIFVGEKAASNIDSKQKVAELLVNGWRESLVFIIQNSLIAVKSDDSSLIILHTGNAASMLARVEADFDEMAQEFYRLFEVVV
jgi:hypothetical protein